MKKWNEVEGRNVNKKRREPELILRTLERLIGFTRTDGIWKAPKVEATTHSLSVSVPIVSTLSLSLDWIHPQNKSSLHWWFIHSFRCLTEHFVYPYVCPSFVTKSGFLYFCLSLCKVKIQNEEFLSKDKTQVRFLSMFPKTQFCL